MLQLITVAIDNVLSSSREICFVEVSLPLILILDDVQPSPHGHSFNIGFEGSVELRDALHLHDNLLELVKTEDIPSIKSSMHAFLKQPLLFRSEPLFEDDHTSVKLAGVSFQVQVSDDRKPDIPFRLTPELIEELD